MSVINHKDKQTLVEILAETNSVPRSEPLPNCSSPGPARFQEIFAGGFDPPDVHSKLYSSPASISITSLVIFTNFGGTKKNKKHIFK